MATHGDHDPSIYEFRADPSDDIAHHEIGEEFLDGTEHTLRTTLTIVKGFAQIIHRQLRQPALDLERVTANAERLDEQITQFERQVERYFAASRLHWGRWAGQTDPVALFDLTSQLLATYQQAAGGQARHLFVLTGEPDIEGAWNQRWLSQAIDALISNAVRYSPDGGEIRLEIARTEQDARVTVHDTGIGIAPDEQPYIFHPFVRGDAARHIAPGWGLGLFITAQVVTHHHGSIIVASTPGRGSAVTLRLPLAPPAMPA